MRGLLLMVMMVASCIGCSTAPLAGFLDRFYPGGVRNRDFDRDEPGSGGGINVGPPRPIDPLVESPGLAIPRNTTPSPRAPTADGVVPPPELGRTLGEVGRTAAYRSTGQRNR